MYYGQQIKMTRATHHQHDSEPFPSSRHNDYIAQRCLVYFICCDEWNISKAYQRCFPSYTTVRELHGIFDMIWYTYLLTAIGLTPSGSITVHIYTQYTERHKTNTQYSTVNNNTTVRLKLPMRSFTVHGAIVLAVCVSCSGRQICRVSGLNFQLDTHTHTHTSACF